MEVKEQTLSINELLKLAGYTHYLLNERLQEFVRYQLQLTKELKLPIMKLFSHMSEEELYNFSLPNVSEYLTYLSENNAGGYIDFAVKRWTSNQLPNVDKYSLNAEDITLITYLRKKSLMHFLTDYAKDAQTILSTIEEIDFFLLQSETKFTDVYISLLTEKLKESEERYAQAEGITKIGNYIWYFDSNEIFWSEGMFKIYETDPQPKLQYEDVKPFTHPDDQAMIRSTTQKTIADNTPFDTEYRIITPSGKIKTVCARGELKYEDGKPVALIGTVQDITTTKTLIDKLEKSEQLYKQVQAQAHIGNWTHYIENNELIWSEEMFRIYDLPIEEGIDLQKLHTIIHPDDLEQYLNDINNSIKEKKYHEFYFRLLLPNGNIKYIHRRGDVILDNNGEVIKLIGTSQDVTQQQKIEQELRENQIFIRKIADATPSIIASYNINSGEFVFVSEGVRKLLGYDPDEALQKGTDFFSTIIHPDDQSVVMEQNNKVLQEANKVKTNDIVSEFRYRMRHSDGSYRWFHTYGTIFDRNKEGNVEHVLNISLDVTEQVAATEKIKEQEHFIQHIADSSPTILYLFDVPSQKFIYINREIFFVLGYTTEEITSTKEATKILYHSEDIHLLPERNESERKFQYLDSMIQYECRLKTKDNNWRWLLVREVVFKTDEDGNIQQILGAALDINKRKDIEKELLQNSFQLQQSNSSLEEFAYVASHDLKEPLRKISTFGDRLIASQQNNLTPDGKIYLDKIVNASQRMQTMINDLLSISMISGNKQYEECSLQTILEDALLALEFKIEQQNAIIEADKLPDAQIVPSQFRQLFQNLLSNSLKFVKENEQPHIKIKHSYVKPEKVEKFQLQKAKRYHQLEFIDNGIGFEEEYQQKIFAIFHRLHGRSEYEGTGIGLAICKKIVEHHGGAIYAHGEPDKGATFSIILPA